MTGPFEMVGDDAPVCEDGVCEMPVEAEASGERTRRPSGAPEPWTVSRLSSHVTLMPLDGSIKGGAPSGDCGRFRRPLPVVDPDLPSRCSPFQPHSPPPAF